MVGLVIISVLLQENKEQRLVLNGGKPQNYSEGKPTILKSKLVLIPSVITFYHLTESTVMEVNILYLVISCLHLLDSKERFLFK